MQSFWFTILFLLTCAPSPLSCASSASLGRRHLYVDDGILPPPPPLTSPSFFPLYSSAPPPPTTTFAAFPTFPANISALVLPRSPKSHSASPKLVVPALSALLAVATAIGLALFLYGRWRGGQGQKRHFKETDSTRSSSSSHDEPRHVTTNFSVAAPTSTSEVLYIGVEESGTCFVNSLSSPEIRPLPPLPPRGFQPNYVPDFVSDEEEEEDEEFFSPLASLPVSQTSSPSRSPYSSSSSASSSSRWVSPARSFSITISPIHHSNPRFELNLHSPSPDRPQVNRKGSSSLRMFSFLNQNVGFPRISSASTSPDRCITTPDAYARSSLYSSVSNSPDGFIRKFLDSSPPIWNDFSRNVKSVLLSSHSTRDFVINIGQSSSPEFARPQWSQEAALAPPPPTRPPPLVPPSHSFVVQPAAKNLSFPPNMIQRSLKPFLLQKTFPFLSFVVQQGTDEEEDAKRDLQIISLGNKNIYSHIFRKV